MAKPNAAGISDARRTAFEKLNIPLNNRVILSLDGGGMRGILTVQLLKKLEEIAGIPCYELFDMVAGTSTGAIIAGLVTTGHTAADIEEKYINLVTEVFDKRFLGNRYLNPPAFSKKNYRKLLKGIVTDLTLEQACDLHNVDLMITAQDLSAAEETFFSCFRQVDGTYYGTYKEVLLRAVMEATMSAPTYFNPLERFVDGGTTTYNNPSLAAFMEALSYSTPAKDRDHSSYSMSALTMFSFGTGISRQFTDPNKTTGIGVNNLMHWLNWIMTETGQDASAMQVNTFRSKMIGTIIDFRRYQISLDASAIGKLPNTDELDEQKYGTKWLREVSNEILHNIDMADTSRFDLMQVIGKQMSQFIMDCGNGFCRDLTEHNRDMLVSAYGDIDRIKKQMKDPQWIDSFKY